MRGVRYAKRYKKYEARIQHDGTRYFLGHHDTAEEAYSAYVAKYKEYFGEYAKINGGGND